MFQAPLSVPSVVSSGCTPSVAKALPPAPSPAPFRRRCVVGDAPASRAIVGAFGAPLQASLGCHLRAPLGHVKGATAAPLSVVEAQLRQRR